MATFHLNLFIGLWCLAATPWANVLRCSAASIRFPGRELRQWLPFEFPQLLLLTQQMNPLVLARFRLVAPMGQRRELTVQELIPQSRDQIGELPRRIGNRTTLG